MEVSEVQEYTQEDLFRDIEKFMESNQLSPMDISLIFEAGTSIMNAHRAVHSVGADRGDG